MVYTKLEGKKGLANVRTIRKRERERRESKTQPKRRVPSSTCTQVYRSLTATPSNSQGTIGRAIRRHKQVSIDLKERSGKRREHTEERKSVYAWE